MTLVVAARVVAVAVAVLTLLFLAFGLTANRDLFLPADVVLGVLLVGAAFVPDPRLAAPWLLAGFAYTAGVFSVSVTIAAVRGPFNVGTTVGLAVAVLFTYLLGRWCLENRSP